MRFEYEITEAELERLLEASNPVVCMKVGSYAPRSPQENANAAWKALGGEKGFDHMTVQPIPGKEQRFFTAEELKEAVAEQVEAGPSGAD